MLAPLVLFFYLFQFPLNIISSIFNGVGITIPSSLVSSSTLLLIPFLVIIILNKNYQLRVYQLVTQKKIMTIIIGIISLILFSGIFVVLRGTNDFSFTIMLLPQLSQVLIGILILPYMLQVNTSIKKLCVEVFFLQSLVELFSMMSPTFLNATNMFRISQSITRSMNPDGGARATGIAIVSYFGLAVAFAVIEFLFIYFWDEIKFSNIILKFTVLLTIIFGGLVAGRTSAIGLIFGFFVIIVKRIVCRKKGINLTNWTTTRERVISVVSIFIIILLLIGVVVSTNLLERVNAFFLKNSAFQSFKTFVMKLFINYQTTGSFSDNSTEALQTMYFPIAGRTVIFGDALFTNVDQSYYMHTDGGYMRQFLFGGVFGFIALVWYQIQFLKLNKQRFFSGCLFLLLCILNYKGIILGTSIIIQSMLLVILVDSQYKDRGFSNE